MAATPCRMLMLPVVIQSLDIKGSKVPPQGERKEVLEDYLGMIIYSLH